LSPLISSNDLIPYRTVKCKKNPYLQPKWIDKFKISFNHGLRSRRHVIKAILFDIDGTIMNCQRAAGMALVLATKEVFGTIGRMERVSFHGKTDPLILRESLLGMGFEPENVQRKIPALKQKYFSHLDTLLKTEECRLMPGVESLITRLREEKDLLLGLLTGNFTESARIKLDRFCLFSQFSFGVYGDDAEIRNGLPPVARKRIREIHGIDIPFSRMIIIGDTVYDVQCAKFSGAVSIAVGTGWVPHDDLLQEKPDYFFRDLSDVDHVLEVIRSI